MKFTIIVALVASAFAIKIQEPATATGGSTMTTATGGPPMTGPSGGPPMTGPPTQAQQIQMFSEGLWLQCQKPFTDHITKDDLKHMIEATKSMMSQGHVSPVVAQYQTQQMDDLVKMVWNGVSGLSGFDFKAGMTLSEMEAWATANWDSVNALMNTPPPATVQAAMAASAGAPPTGSCGGAGQPGCGPPPPPATGSCGGVGQQGCGPPGPSGGPPMTGPPTQAQQIQMFSEGLWQQCMKPFTDHITKADLKQMLDVTKSQMSAGHVPQAYAQWQSQQMDDIVKMVWNGVSGLSGFDSTAGMTLSEMEAWATANWDSVNALMNTPPPATVQAAMNASMGPPTSTGGPPATGH